MWEKAVIRSTFLGTKARSPDTNDVELAPNSQKDI